MTVDIINLAERRRKKEIEEALARGRVPLTAHWVPMPPVNNDSFAERIMRIKASLERINALMADLKKNVKEEK